MQIDYERVPVANRLMPVRVGVRFRSLPAFVLVLMVLIMNMKVGMVEAIVGVIELGASRSGPGKPCSACGYDQ